MKTPINSLPFLLHMDDSMVGLGERPTFYLSRKFNRVEKKYATTEKEVLVVKGAVESFWYYLLGQEFTNHTP